MRRLQDGFAPVPDGVHERVEAALAQVHREAQSVQPLRRPRLGLLLAIALALMLLLGAAVAAGQFGVLDYLFRSNRGEAPEVLEGMVQQVDAVREKDGVTIRVDEVICDGLALDIVLNASTAEKPYYLVVEDVEFAGKTLGYADQGSNLPAKYIGHPLQATGEAEDFGVSVFRPDWATGQVQVKVRLALMQTENEVVVYDGSSVDEWMLADQDAHLERGQLAVLATGSMNHPEYWIEPASGEYARQARARRGEPPLEEGVSSHVEFMREYCQLHVVHEAELSFTLDVPAPAWVANYRPSAASVLPVEVELAEISSLATRLKIWIGMPDDADYDVWFKQYHEIGFLDETGQPAQYMPMYGREIMASLKPQNRADGSRWLCYSTIVQGYEAPPEKLTILPMDSPYDDGNVRIPAAYYPDYSVTLEKIP